MDYMPNGSLQEKLEKYGAFPNDVTRFYSAELIMAIEYMQQQGVVHRYAFLAGQVWVQSGSDWPQMGKIWDFFRSDFRTFWRCAKMY